MKKVLLLLIFFNGLFITSNVFASGTFECKLEQKPVNLPYTNNPLSTITVCVTNPNNNTCDSSSLTRLYWEKQTNGGYKAITCEDLPNSRYLTCPVNTPIPCLTMDYPKDTTQPNTNTNNGTGAKGETIVNVSSLLTSLGGIGFKFANNASPGAIITGLLPYIYAIAGFGLLILLIVGGFSYLTSAGDPKKMEQAKGTITTAIIGFLIVIAAYWLTEIANYVFKLQTPLG